MPFFQQILIFLSKLHSCWVFEEVQVSKKHYFLLKIAKIFSALVLLASCTPLHDSRIPVRVKRHVWKELFLFLKLHIEPNFSDSWNYLKATFVKYHHLSWWKMCLIRWTLSKNTFPATAWVFEKKLKVQKVLSFDATFHIFQTIFLFELRLFNVSSVTEKA